MAQQLAYHNDGETFIIVMDVLTKNIEKDPPLAMMFADDLVRCAMTPEEVEEDQSWKHGELCLSGMG